VEQEETEPADEQVRENMPGGKAVLMDITKRERAAKSGAEDQTGASGPKEVRGFFFFFFSSFFLFFFIIMYSLIKVQETV